MKEYYIYETSLLAVDFSEELFTAVKGNPTVVLRANRNTILSRAE